MSLLNRRTGYFAIFLACAGMMAFALFLQHYRYLNPCPLCIFQRVCVITVGGVALLAALHNPKSTLGNPGLRRVEHAGRSGWPRDCSAPCLYPDPAAQ